MSVLSNDVIGYILEFLPPKSLICCGSSSHILNSIADTVIEKNWSFNNVVSHLLLEYPIPQSQCQTDVLNVIDRMQVSLKIEDMFPPVLEEWEDGYVEPQPIPSSNVCIVPGNIVVSYDILGQKYTISTLSKLMVTLDQVLKAEMICIENDLTAPGNEGTSYPVPFMIPDNGNDVIEQVSDAFGLGGIINCYCNNFDTAYEPYASILSQIVDIFDYDGDFVPGWAWGRDYEGSTNYYDRSPAVKAQKDSSPGISLTKIENGPESTPERTIYSPETGNLDVFLKQYPPSKTRFQDTPWIQLVKHDSFDSVLNADAQGALHEFNVMAPRQNPRDLPKFIQRLGRKYSVLLGKWMLEFKPEEIDEKWNIIAKAMYNGKLSAATAKVAPSGHPFGHFICVYNKDFGDLGEILKLRRELWRLGFKEPLNYKADIYTVLGIYEKNKWHVPENMYTK